MCVSQMPRWRTGSRSSILSLSWCVKLRMLPDRLMVGEVRGPEVVELLAALNTGHEGGCLV